MNVFLFKVAVTDDVNGKFPDCSAGMDVTVMLFEAVFGRVRFLIHAKCVDDFENVFLREEVIEVLGGEAGGVFVQDDVEVVTRQ